MTHRIIICFILIGFNAFSQGKNEKLLFSFSTELSQTVKLTLDTVNNEMIFRFSKPNEPDLEIKDDLMDSISIFTYSFYFRGGGINNAGLDLNYISFANKESNYTIYSEYTAEDEITSVGIKISNSNNTIISDTKGIYKTVQGSLVSPFRWDQLIPIIDME